MILTPRSSSNNNNNTNANSGGTSGGRRNNNKNNKGGRRRHGRGRNGHNGRLLVLLFFVLGFAILFLTETEVLPDFRQLLTTATKNNNSQSASTSRMAKEEASSLSSEASTTTRTRTTIPKLADGCYHVFLDVGSNIGNHVRFLYEPRLYPNARIARRFFDDAFKVFGRGGDGDGPKTRNNRNICVFSFEPNPDHNDRHRQLSQAYTKKGWRYHPINAGVGHQYGNITFYHTGDDLGFTSKQSSCRKRCDPVNVPVIKLSDWIKREIEGRTIPEYVQGDNNEDEDEASRSSPVAIPPPPPPPRVVMKMDIEMMEYEVFPDLMLSGVLCRNIDSMIGEFHMDNSIAYLWREGMNFTTTTSSSSTTTTGGSSSSSSQDNNVWNLSRDKARQISEEWLRMVAHNPDCSHVKISMKDDESYRNDGQPLPS